MKIIQQRLSSSFFSAQSLQCCNILPNKRCLFLNRLCLGCIYYIIKSSLYKEQPSKGNGNFITAESASARAHTSLSLASMHFFLISLGGNLRTMRSQNIKCSSNKIQANEELAGCLSYYNNALRPTIIRPMPERASVFNCCWEFRSNALETISIIIFWVYRRALYLCISHVHTYIYPLDAIMRVDIPMHAPRSHTWWHHSNLKWHQIDKSQLHIEWRLTELENKRQREKFADGVEWLFNIYFLILMHLLRYG